MANAIGQAKNGLKQAIVGLGHHGAGIGSVPLEVHDGDTIAVRTRDAATVKTPDNLSVRFLGVDAAEISFQLPAAAPKAGSQAGFVPFVSIKDPRWEEFLKDPFSEKWGPFKRGTKTVHLDKHLVDDLTSRLDANMGGMGPAANHAYYADLAQKLLEAEIIKDLPSQGLTSADVSKFEFYMVFGFEVMDRYGRLLGYINRNQPKETQDNKRPLSYNERLLEAGMVTPYFIWPNVDPFLTKASITQAVIPKNTANKVVSTPGKLRDARVAMQRARATHTGIFDKDNPLRIMPFELRYLAQRRPPERWVIDLSKNDNHLIPPELYYTIPNIEDRLFIPEEYVPLFRENGWK